MPSSSAHAGMPCACGAFDVRTGLLMCFAAQLPYLDCPEQQAGLLGMSLLEVLEHPGGQPTRVVLAECGDCLVVSFRGSMPLFGRPGGLVTADAIGTWMVNMDVFGPPTPATTVEAALPGRVHRGYAQMTRSLWGEVSAALRRSVTGRRRIWLTGHSQGGALAVLVAAKLAAQGSPPSGVITFGAPRVGDQAFNASVQVPVVRFELADDLVPSLPPNRAVRRLLNTALNGVGLPRVQLAETDYSQIGALQFIDTSGRVWTDASDLVRVARLGPLLADARLRWRMFRDHGLTRYAAVLIATASANASGIVDGVERSVAAPRDAAAPCSQATAIAGRPFDPLAFPAMPQIADQARILLRDHEQTESACLDALRQLRSLHSQGIDLFVNALLAAASVCIHESVARRARHYLGSD